MGSITGHKIDYNGAGALRGQRHIPSKTEPKYPPRGPVLSIAGCFQCILLNESLPGGEKYMQYQMNLCLAIGKVFRKLVPY